VAEDGWYMSRVGRKVGVGRRPSTVSAESSLTTVLKDIDTQLMLDVRAGNHEAFSTLVRRNYARIARYLSRVVGPHGPVEDLTQEVFLKAMREADRYRPQAPVVVWLYQIATNAALNHLKSADVRRRAPHPPDAVGDVPDRRDARPDENLNLDELKRQVQAAVRALPTNQCLALTLFEYEDFSYEQIAEVLNVSVGAVRSLLRNARSKLRPQLGGLK